MKGRRDCMLLFRKVYCTARALLIQNYSRGQNHSIASTILSASESASNSEPVLKHLDQAHSGRRVLSSVFLPNSRSSHPNWRKPRTNRIWRDLDNDAYKVTLNVQHANKRLNFSRGTTNGSLVRLILLLSGSACLVGSMDDV